MSKKNHPIYNLEPWDCWKDSMSQENGETSWRRVPGGWLVTESRRVYDGEKYLTTQFTSAFVPYNEEFLEELR